MKMDYQLTGSLPEIAKQNRRSINATLRRQAFKNNPPFKIIRSVPLAELQETQPGRRESEIEFVKLLTKTFGGRFAFCATYEVETADGDSTFAFSFADATEEYENEFALDEIILVD